VALRNAIAGFVLLLLTGGYALLIATIPDRTLPNTPGPTFFPWLITAAGGLLSLVLLVQGVAGLRAHKEDSGDTRRPGAFDWAAALALAWFALYLVALPTAGFIAASIVFFAGLMVLYGAHTPLVVIASSVGIPFALYLLFRHVFTIILPTGIW